MPQLEIILGLLVAVAALATLATRLKIPYPILLVLGGSALGFVPGLPPVELDPELVFLLFLPPLLYVSALFTSWRDFRANIRPIIEPIIAPAPIIAMEGVTAGYEAGRPVLRDLSPCHGELGVLEALTVLLGDPPHQAVPPLGAEGCRSCHPRSSSVLPGVWTANRASNPVSLGRAPGLGGDPGGQSGGRNAIDVSEAR